MRSVPVYLDGRKINRLGFKVQIRRTLMEEQLVEGLMPNHTK